VPELQRNAWPLSASASRLRFKCSAAAFSAASPGAHIRHHLPGAASFAFFAKGADFDGDFSAAPKRMSG
jgi:hypothetical protein